MYNLMVIDVIIRVYSCWMPWKFFSSWRVPAHTLVRDEDHSYSPLNFHLLVSPCDYVLIPSIFIFLPLLRGAVTKYIRIGIGDKNDNPPYFDQAEYEAEVNEDEDIQHTVITVTAKDKDECKYYHHPFPLHSDPWYECHQLSY